MARSSPAFVLLVVLSVPLGAQSTPANVIQAARAQIAANHTDSAEALLRQVLDSTSRATLAERASALFWHGVVQFYAGNDTATRAAFRQAFALNPDLNVSGLAQMDSTLNALFVDVQRRVGPAVVYVSSAVDEQAYRSGGPSVRYPAAATRRHVQGLVRITLIVDTSGHAEPASIQIETPDTAMAGPVRAMILASHYVPGRKHQQPVRTMMELDLELHAPPPPTATALATDARAALAAHHPDSALALLGDAMDTATHATEGEQMYVLVVRSMARAAANRDSAARADLDSAFGLKKDLAAKHVDLAPFLLRLADSVRLARRGVTASRGPTMGAPTLVSAADAPPVLISHPHIVYPLEMQRLSVSGTVVVEASVDATGHVTATKVVASPNPGLDPEALRVVNGSLYRAAHRAGQAAAVTIRQPITFAGY
jgi:TonB family protein